MEAETNTGIEQRLKELMELSSGLNQSHVSIVRKHFSEFEKIIELYKRQKSLSALTGMNSLKEIALLLHSYGVCDSDGKELSDSSVRNLMFRVRKERTHKAVVGADGKLQVEGVTLTLPKVPRVAKTAVVASVQVAPVVAPTPKPAPAVAPVSSLSELSSLVVVPGVVPIEITDWRLEMLRLEDEAKKRVWEWNGQDQFIWEFFHDYGKNYHYDFPREAMKIQSSLRNTGRVQMDNCLFPIIKKAKECKNAQN